MIAAKSLWELISAEESWTGVLPSFGLSERGEVVRWWEVVGLVMLRWLWIGRNVFGGAVVGLQGRFIILSNIKTTVQSFDLK